jgi:signal transduction histidine kinase
MDQVRARRFIRTGRYGFPAALLAAVVAAWMHPLFGFAAAVAVAAGLWMFLGSVSRWLADACGERVELREQLIQSQKLMALGEISTGIAHEINNPLNIIMQEAELIRVDLQGEPGPAEMDEVRESLDVVIHQVERCSDITHKLLDFARNRRPVTQTADINRLLLDMMSLVERETASKDIQIVKMFSNDVPKIKTDPPLLRQVFLNLLNNAVQAIDGKGMIFVTTRHVDGMACAEIRDTGPGIPPEHLDRIFNPFFTTKPPGEGTGLGLSVSLRIVVQLGGDIQVRSEPGKGAAFTVRIPIDQ